MTDAVQSITKALQRLSPAPFHGAVEALEELGRLALSPRDYRKAVRWDEKNRRRRLKGLPEKPCPYQNRLLKNASANWGKKEQKAIPVIQREIMHMLVWCCGSCGVAITDGDKFCRMCGKRVKWND